MELEILRKIGLSEGEVKVYSAILDLGLVGVSKIHEKIGIERRNIYDILNKLIKKGLVSYVFENKKKSFQVSHPNKIKGYLEEKEQELANTKNEVDEQIPELIKKFNTKKPNINTETYRNSEGIKAVWEDMLNYNKIYWIGSGRYVPNKFPAFFKNWDKRRVKDKIVMHNLLRHELKGKIRHLGLEKRKFLPKEFSVNPVVLCIYGNKVVNFIFGDELFAFVIESRELAENYKKYHKYLWEKVAKS
ncbi:hypothetical protein HY212_02765 [Candidatus Pacearchaeota archaeon]|nr:hypothetical protein [Candidatus Pacearchaeota archaeon]